MLAAFERVAAAFGHTKADARQLFGLLPPDLRAAPVALSKLGERWVYAFGRPYTGFAKGTVVLGTPQIPPVAQLYRTVFAVSRYFSATDQVKLYGQLGQEAKHMDFLEELAPICRLQGAARVQYEVAGEGKQRIDFQIDVDGKRPILLEVKYRCKDLIHYLDHFTKNEALGKPLEEIPPPEPEWLFASVVEKFKPVPFETQAQGVWVYAGVAQVETRLRNYFDQLDSDRLHFAVLSAGEERAYVLARSPEIRDFVQRFFDLTHHQDSVR